MLLISATQTINKHRQETLIEKLITPNRKEWSNRALELLNYTCHTLAEHQLKICSPVAPHIFQESERLADFTPHLIPVQQKRLSNSQIQLCSPESIKAVLKGKLRRFTTGK